MTVPEGEKLAGEEGQGHAKRAIVGTQIRASGVSHMASKPSPRAPNTLNCEVRHRRRLGCSDRHAGLQPTDLRRDDRPGLENVDGQSYAADS
jgi:hypothetical protein